ncbi:hypothetical protein HYT05_02880 [Candidatus Kaiserbacteria bacterium]|nr:hypothetical protein [Candidatus Kaiserbacteria bacterium]
MGNLDSLPKKVKRVIVDGDRVAIKNMARAGGKASGEKRHIEARDRRDEKDYYAEKATRAEHERAKAANEHIVPIDPEIGLSDT